MRYKNRKKQDHFQVKLDTFETITTLTATIIKKEAKFDTVEK